MKKWTCAATLATLLLLSLWPLLTVSGQEETFRMEVVVDSAFIRALPSFDAQPTTSVFENDILIALGRNADGTWFQVRRLNRDAPAGWIARQTVDYDFTIAELPMTDFTTGLVGDTAIVDSGYTVQLQSEVTLRAGPSTTGDPITIVPIDVTLPALERSPDDGWIKVNYLGQVGWVAEYLTRLYGGQVSNLPIAPELAPQIIAGQSVSVPIIPPEVQLAQVQRLRDYITPLRALSSSMSDYWAVVQTGEIVPCNPPPGTMANYLYSQRDFFELPELRRYVRRLERAVTDLNSSIVAMQRCGVYTPDELGSAYAQVVNATIIFDALLSQLQDLEENVIRFQ